MPLFIGLATEVSATTREVTNNVTWFVVSMFSPRYEDEVMRLRPYKNTEAE